MRCAETSLAGSPRVNGNSQAHASALGGEFSWVICVPTWRAAGAFASGWAGYLFVYGTMSDTAGVNAASCAVRK